MNNLNRKLKLDFDNPSTLFLAYPESVVECGIDYTPKPVFDRIIRALPSGINLVVMTKTASIANSVLKLRKKRTTTLVNSELSSIWLRDTAGFNMGSHIVKPIFKPKYYRKYFDEAEIIDSYNKIIHSILGIDMKKIPLIWDGGNLTTNGEVGFITEQILHDNKKTHAEIEIKTLIKETLGIEPIIVPILSGDPFGHTDGFLNFLDMDTIAISSYPDKPRKKERSYLKELKSIVSPYVKKVVEIKEKPEEAINEDIYSAKGLYVNFLRLGKLIIVPSYQDSEIDKYNYDLIRPFGKIQQMVFSKNSVKINTSYFTSKLHLIGNNIVSFIVNIFMSAEKE
jgi:agmatine/peptidylarginine deiminase